jgi:hypothetical protein
MKQYTITLAGRNVTAWDDGQVTLDVRHPDTGRIHTLTLSPRRPELTRYLPWQTLRARAQHYARSLTFRAEQIREGLGLPSPVR